MNVSASVNQFPKENPNPKDVPWICDLTSERSLQGCHIYLAPEKKNLKDLRLKPARRASFIYTLLFTSSSNLLFIYLYHSFLIYLIPNMNFCRVALHWSCPSLYVFLFLIFLLPCSFLLHPPFTRLSQRTQGGLICRMCVSTCLEQGLLMLAGFISLPLFSFYLQSKLIHFTLCF